MFMIPYAVLLMANIVQPVRLLMYMMADGIGFQMIETFVLNEAPSSPNVCTE